MAKVQFSGIVSEARNKVGNIVYSRNKYGAYSRAYATGYNKGTTEQLAIQSSFGTYSQYWQTLTDEERFNWAVFAQQVSRVDVFGNPYKSNGFSTFMSVMMERSIIGYSTLYDIPTSQFMDTSARYVFDVDLSMNEMIIDRTANPTLLDSLVVIQLSEPLSAGKTYFRNLVSTLIVRFAYTGLAFNLYSDYVSKYGTIPSGKRIGWTVYTVTNVNAIKSPAFHGYFNT